MSKFAKELVTSLGQAATHARGRMVVGVRITPVKARRRRSEKRAKGRKHTRNRMDEN